MHSSRINNDHLGDCNDDFCNCNDDYCDGNDVSPVAVYTPEACPLLQACLWRYDSQAVL